MISTATKLTCEKCLSGRHSVLCENNGCACNLCAKWRRAAPVRKSPRKKHQRKPVPTPVRTPEQKRRNAEASKRAYRDARQYPKWSYDNEALADKLEVLLTKLVDAKFGSEEPL